MYYWFEEQYTKGFDMKREEGGYRDEAARRPRESVRDIRIMRNYAPWSTVASRCYAQLVFGDAFVSTASTN